MRGPRAIRRPIKGRATMALYPFIGTNVRPENYMVKDRLFMAPGSGSMVPFARGASGKQADVVGDEGACAGRAFRCVRAEYECARQKGVEAVPESRPRHGRSQHLVSREPASRPAHGAGDAQDAAGALCALPPPHRLQGPPAPHPDTRALTTSLRMSRWSSSPSLAAVARLSCRRPFLRSEMWLGPTPSRSARAERSRLVSFRRAGTSMPYNRDLRQ